VCFIKMKEKPFAIPENCKTAFGVNATIYFASDDLAVKMPSCWPMESIRKDYLFHKALANNGYSYNVPELYCFGAAMKDKEVRESIFMGHIHGNSLDVCFDCRYSVEDMMSEAGEISKSIKSKLHIGVRPTYGLKNKNVMWDRENERVVLIDFGQWIYL